MKLIMYVLFEGEGLMLKKGLSKAKITALAVALCMISMSLKEEGALASADGSVYYTWPVPSSATIDKNYGKGYDGIDITSEKENTEVVVARDGVVEIAKSDDCHHIANYPNYCCNNGLGNYVKIKHEDGSYATYSHLKAGSVTVSEGQEVVAGTVLGIMGASGRTDKVCLHFSVAYSDTRSVNTNPDVMKYIYPTNDETSQEESTNMWKILVDSGVNFRSGAGTTFQVLGKIPYDEVVEVSEEIEVENLRWGKTIYNGETGWFALKYAKEVDSEKNKNVTKEETKDNIYVDLKLNPNGGECEYSSYMYAKGSIIGELPTPTRPGYEFVGWYTEKNEGTAINMQDKICEEMTIYAHWR